MERYFQHHFLLAMPSIVDAFFYRSVIYIFRDNNQGTMGLVINQPTQIMLSELLQNLNIKNEAVLAKKSEVSVFCGGPFRRGMGTVLHDGHSNWEASIPITENINLTTSTDVLSAFGSVDGPENILVSLGYVSWEEGQLVQELKGNDWLVTPGDFDILFKVPVSNRRQSAAQLLGFDINLISNSVGHA